jgi:hypothetical protein
MRALVYTQDSPHHLSGNRLSLQTHRPQKVF